MHATGTGNGALSRGERVTNRPRSQRARYAAGLLGLVCLATLAAPARGQYYPSFTSGSRKEVRLRSNLAVGWGPSTIAEYNIQRYSFGVNDLFAPQVANGSGVLGSSMYRAQNLGTGSRTVGGTYTSTPTAGGTPAPRNIRYAPASALRIGAAGPVATRGRTGISGLLLTPDEEVTQDPAPGDLPPGRITTLVPKVQWESNAIVAAGEKLLKAGKYKEARAEYDKAYAMAPKSPTVLLSMFHVALAQGAYDEAGRFLAAAVQAYPYLPLVDVHPRDFIAAPGAYAAVFAGVEKHVRDNPKDLPAALSLGYLQMRDNLLPIAVKSLEPAAKSENREIAAAAEVFLKAMAHVRARLQAEGVTVGDAIVFATAGLKAALPEGFHLQPLVHPNQMLLATNASEATSSPRSLIVTGHVLDTDVPLDKALDHVMGLAARDVAVSGLSPFDEMTLTYLGQPALARLYACKYLGQDVALVRLCFVREVPASGDQPAQRILYVLGMGLLERDIEALLPTFSAFARSVSLVDLVAPDQVKASKPLAWLASKAHGVRVGLPTGWAGQLTESGCRLSATDWTAGGVVGPTAEAVFVPAPADTQAKAFGEAQIAKRNDAGAGIEVVREAPARLATVEGHGFLLRVAAPAGAEKNASPALVAARVAAVPAPDDQGAVCVLVVESPGAKPDALWNLADALAGDMALTAGQGDRKTDAPTPANAGSAKGDG